jgi:hypothetical protein
MFALLSRRLRRLLIFMIAVPLGGRLLEAAGRRLEQTSGPTQVSRVLRSGGRAAGRAARGPLRPRYPQPEAAPGSSVNGSRRRAARTGRAR